MSIKDFFQKIKSSGFSSLKETKIHNDLFIVLLIILVGTASFGIGKLSGLERQKVPISILKTKDAMYASVASSPSVSNVITTNQSSTTEQKGIVLASKSGTKYYYPWCSGVSRIKDENKVWFLTVSEAEATGLTLASGCTAVQN